MPGTVITAPDTRSSRFLRFSLYLGLLIVLLMGITFDWEILYS